MTSRRSSSPALIREAVQRARAIVDWDSGVEVISCRMSAGWMSGLYCTLESSGAGVDVLGVRLDSSKFVSQSRTSSSRRRRIT